MISIEVECRNMQSLNSLKLQDLLIVSLIDKTKKFTVKNANITEHFETLRSVLILAAPLKKNGADSRKTQATARIIIVLISSYKYFHFHPLILLL